MLDTKCELLWNLVLDHQFDRPVPSVTRNIALTWPPLHNLFNTLNPSTMKIREIKVANDSSV